MMSKSTLRALLAVATVLVLAGTVSGCSGPGSGSGSASPETVAATSAAAPVPSPTARPIEEVVELDPLAEPLVGAGHALVAGSEGFAPVEARTQLDMATAALEADVQVVQLSMAGGPAASQAAPPVDEARIAADIAAFYAAAQAVRQGVVDTAIRVVNDEAPNADAALRDDLYLAIVAQQSQTVATDDTPRQVLELVAKVRAAQDSQAAYAAEQERQAAEQSSSGGGSGGGSGTGSDGPTLTRIPICIQWPPFCYTDAITGEQKCVASPPSGPDCP
jgi:hypothetical protein